jgi:RNA polymerase sigma-70 factor (ECF subfamily)
MDSRLRSEIEGGAAAGDGFEAFYEAQEQRLYGTLCLMTGDRGEAEEVMQEAFLRVWERWDRVRLLDDPAGYLYRTAFNVFRNRVRRLVRAAKRRAYRDPHVDPFDRVIDREDLLAAMRRLSPRQRAALVVLDLMDISSEEGGRLLGVRPATVRSLASQARQAVRKSLEVDHG